MITRSVQLFITELPIVSEQAIGKRPPGHRLRYGPSRRITAGLVSSLNAYLLSSSLFGCQLGFRRMPAAQPRKPFGGRIRGM